MSKLVNWIDARFPLSQLWNSQLAKYYAPKNFNFWYYFGSLALVALVIQIVSGIFLAMNYKPDANLAFASVQYIMRDVDWGWLIRYIHSTGASMFFAVIYLHMFRSLLYGSHHKPRELLWIFGVLIFVALIAEAFLGYLLPWGNMSYWGAQVIVNLFNAVPYIGPGLSQWIRGDFVISDVTLNRFFAFHVIVVPLAFIGLVVMHVVALHEVGSNNPDGIEIREKKDANGIPLDGIPFHPYYTVKDLFGIAVFLIVFAAIIFFAPTMGGWFIEHDNFVPADPMQTPPEIHPMWYFTPFYAILRAIPPVGSSQFPGVLIMAASIVVLFLLPWLDRSPVKSIRYRGWMYKLALTILVISFVTLGFLGIKPPTGVYKHIAQVCTALYFLFFLLMPWYTKYDKTKPVPERVTG